MIILTFAGGLVFIILVGAALVALTFLCVRLLAGFFGKTSGWKELSERYPSGVEPVGVVRTGQTIELNGIVRYRFSTHVNISAQGLFLKQQVLAVHPPLFIPWKEISLAGDTIVYWRKVKVLSIGVPRVGTIAVFPDIYELILPYLRHGNSL